MKILFLLLITLLPLFSKSIYFVQSSSNTDELEAKIVSQVAKSFLNVPNVYIAGAEGRLTIYFSNNLNVEPDCNKANFIYIKKGSKFDINTCEYQNKIIFTDDKHTFKKNENIFGAFFWFKSRPNVQISSKKAKALGIDIPSDYLKFMDHK